MAEEKKELPVRPIDDSNKLYKQGENVYGGLRGWFEVVYKNGDKEKRMFSQKDIDLMRANGAEIKPVEAPGEPKEGYGEEWWNK